MIRTVRVVKADCARRSCRQFGIGDIFARTESETSLAAQLGPVESGIRTGEQPFEIEPVIGRQRDPDAGREVDGRIVDLVRCAYAPDDPPGEHFRLAGMGEAGLEDHEFVAAEARDEYAQKLKLVDSGGFSAGDARRLGLRADALAAKADSLQQERPARDAKIIAARGDLEAARVARTELIAETLARDEAKAAFAAANASRDIAAATRDTATIALERSEIRAPRDGVVLNRIARPGSRVGGDADALITIFDPASLQVRCDVPLKDAGKLAVGLVAEIRVDAFPDRVFHGKIVRIVPQSDIQKNTVQCKVEIESPDEELRPDMLARVRIATAGSPQQAQGESVAIPAESLRARDGNSADVLVAMPDAGAARAELRHISLGIDRANGWIEVIDGLSAGDRVVIDESIRPGSRIIPIETAKEETP